MVLPLYAGYLHNELPLNKNFIIQNLIKQQISDPHLKQAQIKAVVCACYMEKILSIK